MVTHAFWAQNRNMKLFAFLIGLVQLAATVHALVRLTTGNLTITNLLSIINLLSDHTTRMEWPPQVNPPTGRVHCLNLIWHLSWHWVLQSQKSYQSRHMAHLYYRLLGSVRYRLPALDGPMMSLGPGSKIWFFSRGDYPIDAFVRMNWNSTKIDNQVFPSDDKCQLEPFCVSMSPSDLKTFRITWKAKWWL